MFGLRHYGWAGQSKLPTVSYIHRKSGLQYEGSLFRSLNYSDDPAGAEPKEREEASFKRMGDLLVELDLAEALDKAAAP